MAVYRAARNVLHQGRTYRKGDELPVTGGFAAQLVKRGLAVEDKPKKAPARKAAPKKRKG